MEYEVVSYHFEGEGEKKYGEVNQGDLNEIVLYLYHEQKVTASASLMEGICRKRESPLIITMQDLTDEQLEQTKKDFKIESTRDFPESFLELIPLKK